MVFGSKHLNKAYNTTVKTKELRSKIELFSKSIKKKKDMKTSFKKFFMNCCLVGNNQLLKEEDR